MENYKSLIGHLPVADHAIGTKLATWEKYQESHPEIWNTIQSIFSGELEVKLCRQDLKDIADTQDYNKLIIATILWGYSSGMRGNNFSKIVNKLPEIASLLKCASQGIDDWKIHYNKVKEISGLGLSTYSKFLYFVGGKIEGHEPLILDIRVIEAINTGIYKEFVCMKRITYTNAPNLYPEYLKIMNDFAVSSECTAAQAEMFLFMFGQNLKQHT
ncbi:hypothetical protein CGI93_22415 [Vibrio parahaemolyticus]|uniref:8-oxoguanine DNA glycosylase OGG fold protein n=1 Tax=Vibrio parahaemolyticus TaxID=670 RepID=UPI0011237B2C|nr:hypothetical protein [Vibrio parahaemolyticus]TOG81128.1 hypothetical protein CGI93_22415 [Vibrio parahaemolyticus]HCK0617606.1 hypothetical protein [Vibrio parahaemolyticus]